MKKLIIILFLMPFVLSGQDQDKVNHFAAGFLIGGIGNIQTYDFIKDTDLKPWQSKTISFAVGSGLGILAGHLKEKYDEKNGGVYSKSDFRATLYGSLSGSFCIRLVLWNSIPESKVSIEELWLMDQY